MKHSTAVLSIALFLSVAPAAPAGADDSQRTHTVTVEDYATLAFLSLGDVSPDDRHVAYVEGRWEMPGGKRNHDVWVVETDTAERTRLTFDPATDTNPRWSTDCQWIYFTSDRSEAGSNAPPLDGSTQVWRIRPDGAGLQPVTRIEGGVDSFDLSDDGRTLYYAVSQEQHDEEWKDLRDRFADLVEFSAGTRQVSEVWALDLESWRAELLTSPERYVRSFDVAPGGQRIALITTPDARLITHEGQSRVDLFDTRAHESAALPDALWRSEAPSPNGWITELAWSSDGGALAFMVAFDGYPSEVFVAELLDGSFTPRKLPRPDETYVVGNLQWRPETRDLYFIGDTRATQRIYCVREVRDGRSGSGADVSGEAGVIDEFRFCQRQPGLVAIRGDRTSHGDLCIVLPGEDNTAPPTLVRANPQVDTWKLPQMSLVQWKAPDGVTVEGVLELPPDYKPGDGALPMIVEIHGGPTGSTSLRLRFWSYGRTIMPANGYALLSPNYRGSSGYGDKFLIDLIGRENDIEVQDILAGVDALVERGIADPQRLGVMGWSNGGYLTNCLISTTTRFKAASSGAGNIDQLLQWGIEDTPGHVVNFMRGLPWEQPEAYRSSSVVYNLGKVTTPTLIHCGESDPRVPVQHSRVLFRALHDYLAVPTQLIIYPGQGHGLSNANMRIAKMTWDLAWFEKYILQN